MIRNMTVEDIEAVSAIEQECFSDPWSPFSLKTEIHILGSVYYVVEEEGQIVGYGGFRYIYEVGEITRIAVKKDHQKKGFASKILNEFEITCKGLDVEEMLLEVRKDNIPGINLYQKHGFEVISTRKNYYGNGCDALIMKKIYK